MFTGIIETLGTVISIEKKGGNLRFEIQSTISNQLKIDQSVAHNGVCLTVVDVDKQKSTHSVVAIEETLQKTNLSNLKVNHLVNLERCMQMNGRLDGHIVQGHVDTTAKCVEKTTLDGSWKFTFGYDTDTIHHITVEKGSICINGTSLTVVDSARAQFSVCIIPYTYENTVFKSLEAGDSVNLEFDIIGKYVAQYAQFYIKP